MLLAKALYIWGLVQFSSTIIFTLMVARGTELAAQHIMTMEQWVQIVLPSLEHDSIDMLMMVTSLTLASTAVFFGEIPEKTRA